MGLNEKFFKSAAGSSETGTFSSLLYTGDGTSTAFDIGFKPDLNWIKSLAIKDHVVNSTVLGIGSQGGGNILYPNGGYPLSTNADSSYFTSFDTLGFTLGGNSYYNGASQDYVAYSWKAGGNSHTFNINGVGSSSIPAALDNGAGNANPVAASVGNGVGIYQFNNVAGAITFKHALGVQPDVQIQKMTSGTSDWYIKSSSIMGGTSSQARQMRFDSTIAENGGGSLTSTNSIAGITGATHSVFVILFAQVSGKIRMGNYTGNGNSTGPRVYSTDNASSGGANGFTPALLFIKGYTDLEFGGAAWFLYDNKRNPTNPANRRLYPEGNYADQQNSNYNLDLLSDGFQIKAGTANYGFNNSNSKYMYWMFGE